MQHPISAVSISFPLILLSHPIFCLPNHNHPSMTQCDLPNRLPAIHRDVFWRDAIRSMLLSSWQSSWMYWIWKSKINISIIKWFGCLAYGEMSKRCTSGPKDSAISRPPILAIAWSAKQLLISFISSRSFFVELTTKRIRSLFSWNKSVTAR